jgi:1-aminocyclopropane-1-carboxylate deaminase
MLTTLPQIPLQKIEDNIFKDKNIQLYLLRLDKSDAVISGNKWFKLKYNLIEAKKNNYNTLLTFGGAYSNHIHATAAVAKKFNFSSIGIIRGEAAQVLNPTLQDATEMGMHLHYINRIDYRKKNQADYLASIINHFQESYGKIYMIPEGGSNSLAIRGASEIIDLIPVDYNYLCLPCGTGGTLAGISSALAKRMTAHKETKLLGFPALKGADFLNDDILQLLKTDHKNATINWELNLDYHFGGYAKIKYKTGGPQLLPFIENFYRQQQIELDFIYTAKMMYGIYDLCKKNYFKENTTIVAIHTGGLQGNRSSTPIISIQDKKTNE